MSISRLFHKQRWEVGAIFPILQVRKLKVTERVKQFAQDPQLYILTQAVWPQNPVFKISLLFCYQGLTFKRCLKMTYTAFQHTG